MGRIERHMMADPQGKNTGFTTPQTMEGRSGEEERGREGRKLNYWEEDSVELMSLHLQRSNI